MKLRTPIFRICVLSLLVTFALLTSGCVYFRLLELKSQLADFDRNFALETTDGVHLVFLHPVLLGDDLRWLGADPQEIIKTGDHEHWHVRWVKQSSPKSKDTMIHDVELFAQLRDRELQSLQIPERYFEFFPKELFVDLLRSTGKARINKQSHQAEVNTATSPAEEKKTVRPPQLSAVEQLLGPPTEISSASSGLVRYKYRYQAKIPSGTGKFIEATFSFDPETGQLRRLIVKLPKGTMNFNFAAP